MTNITVEPDMKCRWTTNSLVLTGKVREVVDDVATVRVAFRGRVHLCKVPVSEIVRAWWET